MHKSCLSLPLKIACEIYWCNKKDISCTTQLLIDAFSLYHIDKKLVVESIDTLFDWSMLKCEWCNDTRTYFIPKDIAKATIKSLYKKYWKEERKNISIIAACDLFNRTYDENIIKN